MTAYYTVCAIAFAVFFIASIWTGRALVSLLGNPTLKQIVVFLPIEIAMIIVASIVLYYTTGGGFGPGILLVLLVIGAPISFIIAVLQLLAGLISLIMKKPGWAQKDLLLLVILGILVPFLFIAPVFGSFKIGDICDRIDRQDGEKIAQAILAYQRDMGSYPNQVESLVPKYIDSIPLNICKLPHKLLGDDDTRYRIERCPYDSAVLTIWTVGGGWGQSYDLATPRWKYYDFSRPWCYPPHTTK
jgi:hypothetical protein